jgi:cell division protease FtsH
MEDFTNAIERIVAGLEKRNRLLNPREREIVAYHEMGHALAAMALPGVDDVHKVSIIPRGIGALGYTIQRPTEDRFLMTREELESKIAVLLGGRAAEGLVFGHLSTGASDDLARATEIARSMATRYGMNEELGSVSYEDAKRDFLGQPSPGRRIANYSDTTAELIDAAVRDTISSAHRRVFELLRSNRATLERSAQDLLEKETLTAADLEAYRKDLASRGEAELAETA